MTTDDETLRILVVEDDPTRVEVFEAWLQYLHLPCQFRIVWSKSAGSAIGLLERDRGKVYAGIMLDHDLNQQSLSNVDRLFSGKDVTKKIIEVTDTGTPILIHSTNESGGPKMKGTLEGAGFSVELVPFYALDFEQYRDWLSYVCEVSQS
jgi:CheY-like chemotaxis protein